MSLVVGIDASRNRSGGAIANLAGIVREGDPSSHGIGQVHLWTYKKLADFLPEKPWLVKHTPTELEKSILIQVWWQCHSLPAEARKARCDILYSTDAATLCPFRPMVVMSQDMVSYEPGVMGRLGFGRTRLRALAILLLQNMAFRRSEGVIFLTRYAGRVIQKSCGALRNITYIPHGVGDEFSDIKRNVEWPTNSERPIRCMYVSPVWEFKHQWEVVRAIEALRRKGYQITLTLVGGGSGKAKVWLDTQIRESDPKGEFVEQLGFVSQDALPNHLANADIFVFASSCENMPISLIEAMAVGLLIACSERGPMPEVLQDGGVYFNPEDGDSIANAIKKIVEDAGLRERISRHAKTLSQQYTWSRCAHQTWEFIANTCFSYKKQIGV